MMLPAIVSLLLIAAARADQPDCNVTLAHGRKYLFCERLNATLAELYCKSRRGHLVTIASADEQQIVETILGKLEGCEAVGGKSVGVTYIGLSDKIKEGDWQWYSGNPSNFTHWNLGVNVTAKQPNGLNQARKPVDQDYVVMQRCPGSTYGRWFDVKGEAERSFLCDLPNVTQKDGQKGRRRDLKENASNTRGASTSVKTPLPTNKGGRKPSSTKFTDSANQSNITATFVATYEDPDESKKQKEGGQIDPSRSGVPQNNTSAATASPAKGKRNDQTSNTDSGSSTETSDQATFDPDESNKQREGGQIDPPRSGVPQNNKSATTASPDIAAEGEEKDQTSNTDSGSSKETSDQALGDDNRIPLDRTLQPISPPEEDDKKHTEMDNPTVKAKNAEENSENKSKVDFRPKNRQDENKVSNQLRCLMLSLRPPTENYSRPTECSTRLLPIAHLSNPVQTFDVLIASSAARLVIKSRMNNTLSVEIPGIEMKLVPVGKDVSERIRNADDTLTVHFGGEDCLGCDSAKLDNKYLQRTDGEAVVVSAVLKRRILEGTGVYSSKLGEPDTDDFQTYVDQFTSVMCVSVYEQTLTGELKRVNVPATTIFDIRNDTSEARAIETDPRRVVTHVERKCVFLDENDTWQTYGCHIRDESPGSVRCECNHTTAFAIMVSLRSFKVPEWQEKLILFVELIGVFFLFLTLCLLIWLRRNLKKDRVFTQINIILALLLMHISMLVAAHAVAVEEACIAMTVLSHFFMIASSLWMLNEGLVLYKKTCSAALNFDINRLKKWLILIGWVMPAVYVIICVGVGVGLGKYLDVTKAYDAILKRQTPDAPNVTKYERCWLGTHYKMVLAALIPIGVSMCIVMYFLIRVSRVVWAMNIHAQGMMPSDAVAKHGAMKSTVRAIALLIPVLGIPWLFAFMVNIPGAEVVFSTIHGIANGLQGVAFFIIYILSSKDVRQSTSRRLTRRSGAQSFSLSASSGGFISFKKTKTATTKIGRQSPTTTTKSPAISPAHIKSVETKEP